jgi:hypothetical protein
MVTNHLRIRAIAFIVLFLTGCGHIVLKTKTIKIPVPVQIIAPDEVIKSPENQCLYIKCIVSPSTPGIVAGMTEEGVKATGLLIQDLFRKWEACRALVKKSAQSEKH